VSRRPLSRPFRGNKTKSLLIATNNRHKVREIRRILGRLPRRLLGLDAFPPARPVRETGRTLAANALLKARDAVRRTGLPALADDTGLEVKALRGAPGVYSARYAGPGCSYDDNNRKLLRALRRVPPSRRAAAFRTVVALVFPGGKYRLFEGRCPGVILPERRGTNGFGYDPVFRPRGEKRSFAEMSLAAKNRISHRSKAFRRAAAYLRRIPSKGRS
jgi:XTP/dITP diphosphohydrolase